VKCLRGLCRDPLHCSDLVILDDGLKPGRFINWEFMQGKLAQSHSHNLIIFMKFTALTGFSHIVAPQVDIWYLCSATLRRSRGAGLLECEKRFKRSARFRFSIMRSMTLALCVTSCSTFPVVVTSEQGIGYKLTRKVRSHKYHVKGRFGVNKCCWSATFNSGSTRV
jgi:hypothetical protein